MGFWGSFFGRIRKALLPACRIIRKCVLTGLAAVGQTIQITARYALTKLTAASRAVIDYAIDNPIKFGVSSILIVGGILVIVVPLMVGFGSAGVVYGSLAAAWQASIGNVASGSFFALLQSLTMAGVHYLAGSAMILGGLAILLVGFLKKWYDGDDDDSGKKNF